MKKLTTIAAIALAIIPLTTSIAAIPAHKAPHAHKAATVYQCSKCHMKFTAAEAKKDHYKDSMDGGTLVPVK